VPWADRFHTATADELIAQLPQDHARASALLLERLRALGLPEPAARWMGACWKWTVAIEPDARSAQQHKTREPAPPVYLIPDPAQPRLCTRLDARSLAAVRADRLQRGVRDAMASGVQVGSALWVEWAIESDACADDMLALVRAALGADAEPSPKRTDRSGRHNKEHGPRDAPSGESERKPR